MTITYDTLEQKWKRFGWFWGQSSPYWVNCTNDLCIFLCFKSQVTVWHIPEAHCHQQVCQHCWLVSCWSHFLVWIPWIGLTKVMHIHVYTVQHIHVYTVQCVYTKYLAKKHHTESYNTVCINTNLSMRSGPKPPRCSTEPACSTPLTLYSGPFISEVAAAQVMPMQENTLPILQGSD
jgi:hypothetical protein